MGSAGTLPAMPTLQAPPAEAPTLVGGRPPLTHGRDRRRAVLNAPRLDPGRYLAIEDGDEVVVLEVGEAPVRIGRSIGSEIVLEHLSVSRRHAVVARRGEETVILDDRSLNGVVVNGERVRDAVLRDGDEIRLGEVGMRYLHVT